MTSEPPKVFISYSHDSPEHRQRVLALAERLRADGVDAHLDQYVESPPRGWPLWMEDEIEAADFVLVVATETYERRRRGREEEGKGHGVRWEGAIVSQTLYDAALHNQKFLPVLFTAEDRERIPIFLKSVTAYTVDSERGYDLLYRRLTGQRGHMLLHLADVLLERTRLAIDRGERDAARRHLERARERVTSCGYGRREREVAYLAAMVTDPRDGPDGPDGPSRVGCSSGLG